MDELKEALNSIHDVMVFSAKDWSLENRDAWIYGVVCGWDDESYEELSIKFGWTKEDIKRNKCLNRAFSIAK